MYVCVYIHIQAPSHSLTGGATREGWALTRQAGPSLARHHICIYIYIRMYVCMCIYTYPGAKPQSHRGGRRERGGRSRGKPASA